MKFSRLLPVFILFFCWQSLTAQDQHFTLFDMAPLRTNPAYTGAFLGTVRIGGIYRGQWFNQTDGLSTPSFYADAPIIRGFRSSDWIGVGFNFLSDNAGAYNFGTDLGGISAAYHLALNKKATSILTIGGQYNQVSRGIEITGTDPLSEQTIGVPFGGLGTQFSDVGITMSQRESNTNYNAINAGLLYRTEIDKESSMELGLSALHLNSPDAGIAAGGGLGNGPQDSDRKLTFIAHGQYRTQLDEKWGITPKVFWQTTAGGLNNIMLQGWANRKVNEDLTLNFGLGWRVNDAGKLMLGADYKDLRAALAYDVNLSSATQITNNVGGFELAAYYIIKVYKKPELPPSVLCPEF